MTYLTISSSCVRLCASWKVAIFRPAHAPCESRSLRYSRHLRALEERCGASLLRRDTHAMSLTETGYRLLADARSILALADEAGQRLRDDQTVLRWHLHLLRYD